MNETVNFLMYSNKLSKLQKLILQQLFQSKEKGLEYSCLNDDIAHQNNGIERKKTFSEIKKEMVDQYKIDYENTPEDKRQLLSELLSIDLRLILFSMMNNKWNFKKYKLKPSFKASFSRTITRLEKRGLIKTYNYYIPYYFLSKNHALKQNYNDKDYDKLYRKYIELTNIGIEVCMHLFEN